MGTIGTFPTLLLERGRVEGVGREKRKEGKEEEKKEKEEGKRRDNLSTALKQLIDTRIH